MHRLVSSNAVAWAGLLGLTMHCELVAQDSSSVSAAANSHHENVVVLHDGGVLTGQVSRDGDRYVVKEARGEMHVAADQVMLVCRSLEQAYDQRRQQITHPTADAHLALAEWCLRYDLVAQATCELAEARALESHHPKLALLERRLALAIEAVKKPVVAKSVVKSQQPSVGKEQPALNSEVPSDVVERFTRRVQPVLVNNCTLAGCHNRGGTQEFQLDRSLLHGLTNRRSTMRNLAATLALVDRGLPQRSPLLTVPRRAHGGRDEPIFGPRQAAAYSHLVEWVGLVTQSDASASRELDPAEIGRTPTVAAATPNPHLVSPVLRVLEQPAEPSPNSTTINNEKVGVPTHGVAPTPRIRFGAKLYQQWQPRDAFDPELFNRRVTQRLSTAESLSQKAVSERH